MEETLRETVEGVGQRGGGGGGGKEKRVVLASPDGGDLGIPWRIL